MDKPWVSPTRSSGGTSSWTTLHLMMPFVPASPAGASMIPTTAASPPMPVGAPAPSGPWWTHRGR
eukprot:15612662-Heterocapsa_arctica.AAC.1